MSVLTYLLPLLGVIIGGFIGFGSSLLTNRANDRRLQTQLAHDRDLKNREREMSLRKEIYLAAAEAVSAGLIAVNRFSNLEIPHDELTEEYNAKAPSIAKVYLIAKMETVRAVVNFSGELDATFLRLSARRYPLVWQKQQIGFLRTQIDTSLKENSQTLEQQKQFNIEGLHDLRKWNVLTQNFEYVRSHTEQAMREADTLAATLAPVPVAMAHCRA